MSRRKSGPKNRSKSTSPAKDDSEQKPLTKPKSKPEDKPKSKPEDMPKSKPEDMPKLKPQTKVQTKRENKPARKRKMSIEEEEAEVDQEHEHRLMENAELSSAEEEDHELLEVTKLSKLKAGKSDANDRKKTSQKKQDIKGTQANERDHDSVSEDSDERISFEKVGGDQDDSEEDESIDHSDGNEDVGEKDEEEDLDTNANKDENMEFVYDVDEVEDQGEKKEQAEKEKPESPSFISDGKYRNKQRCLVLCSRGVTARFRHLLEDVRTLMPHHKKDSKLDPGNNSINAMGAAVNEIAEMKSCNSVLFLECRKHKDCYMWLGHTPSGPSAKFHISNIHTMDELRLTGNCMKGSRPILSFDKAFDGAKHLQLLKVLFTDVFGTPRGHPKSKPFVDRIMAFYYADSKVCRRSMTMISSWLPLLCIYDYENI